VLINIVVWPVPICCVLAASATATLIAVLDFVLTFVVLVIAMIAGVIASAQPARRAAKMNVLEAVAAE